MPTKGKSNSRKRRTPRKKPEPEPEPVEQVEEEEEDLVDSEASGSEVEDSGVEEESENSGAEEESGEAEDNVAEPKPVSKAKKTKAPRKTKTEAGKRYFKILTDTIKPVDSPVISTDALSSGGGRYTGNNPMQAAKKAFTRIARAGAGKGPCTYIYSIQETTQGSAKKVFRYTGERKELDKPQMIKKGDTTYPIKFRSNVRSYKETPSAQKGGKKKVSRKRGKSTA